MPKCFEAEPWALVILLAAFLMRALVYGLAFSTGLYTDEFLKYFDTSATKVALIGAVNFGVLRMGGPFVSLLLRKFSYRTVAVIGGLLSCIGSLSVVFARDIPGVIIPYGLLTGVGFCISDLLSSVMVSVYFEKNRAIANAIIESGGPLGASSIPLLANRVIEEYTWRGSFYIISCLTAQFIVLGALLRTPYRLKLSTHTTFGERKKTHIKEPVKGTKNAEQASPVFSVCRDIVVSTNIPEDKNEELGESSYIHAMCRDTSESMETDNQLPTQQESLQQLPPSNELMPHEAHLGFKTNLNKYVKVLCTLGFLSFTLSWSLFNFTLVAFSSFLPKFVLSIGLTASDAASLISMRNVTSFLFSIPSGFLMNSKHVNVSMLYITASSVFGVTMILFNYFHSYASIVAIIITGGAVSGAVYCARVIIILELVGTEHAADAIGFSSFASGLGMLAGAPVAGYLYDVTDGFDAMFYCLFAVQCFAGFIMMSYVIQNKCSSVKWSVNRS